MSPEVLAPAGDRPSLEAALAAGADAVYFGLDEGFNARARAENFSLDNLAETVDRIHQAGARAYLTTNTLVFQSELAALDRVLRRVAASGVDALIIQDPAVAMLARAICPRLELHASTQMTISSGEGARFAETLGITRVVVPRELSVREIRRLRGETDLELEVFIAGALCVSWSGQCLSSEAWGGRSANRGQCAQACRMPYELVVDGQTRPLEDNLAYLLSPKDLAGHRAVPELAEMGIHTLKIEGRQKGATYVRTATEGMRRWVDAVARGVGTEDERQLREDVRDLTLAYSRGLSDGFLAGSDHQSLVEGRFPRHRGVYLGRVRELGPDRVLVVFEPEPERPATGQVSSPLPALGGSVEAATGPAPAPLEVTPGMGVLFDEGKPQEHEQGGPIFRVERAPEGLWLGFGKPGPDLARVGRGARVWVTSDPSLARRASRPAAGRSGLAIAASGSEGEPLVLECRGLSLASEERLQRASSRGLEAGVLRAKLSELGGTPFHLSALDLEGLEPGLFLPVSALKALRRSLVERLSAPEPREVARQEVWPGLMERLRVPSREGPVSPRLVPLVRTPEQLEAVIEAGSGEVILDWMELVGLGQAVRRAREAGLKVGIATVRIQKPGEEVYDKRIRALKPDLLLVRHWAGVMHAYEERPAELVGDFSLNVTNALTAFHLLRLGLDRVTVAHDLDEHQLEALLAAVPPERLAVVVHQHIPTFHTEHCVYSNLLSQGRDYRTCGRPCEQHQVALRDHLGQAHPVVVDVGCRNTVFNAAAQSAASLVPRLQVGELRLEFVRETREETLTVLRAYAALLAGELTPPEVLRRVGTHEQFGVTRGTMKVLR